MGVLQMAPGHLMLAPLPASPQRGEELGVYTPLGGGVGGVYPAGGRSWGCILLPPAGAGWGGGDPSPPHSPTPLRKVGLHQQLHRPWYHLYLDLLGCSGDDFAIGGDRDGSGAGDLDPAHPR